ncbi:unnamed protein product [marine sediment metagenome]|uniref:Uncharacterized protein n=1 Tax=marine sediment metagenome TaxID=412755 RepID=X1G4T2_9ZZZZ
MTLKDNAIATFTREFDEPTIFHVDDICKCQEETRVLEVIESNDYYDEKRGFYERIQVERCASCHAKVSFHWVLLEAHEVI